MLSHGCQSLSATDTKPVERLSPTVESLSEPVGQIDTKPVIRQEAEPVQRPTPSLSSACRPSCPLPRSPLMPLWCPSACGHVLALSVPWCPTTALDSNEGCFIQNRRFGGFELRHRPAECPMVSHGTVPQCPMAVPGAIPWCCSAHSDLKSGSVSRGVPCQGLSAKQTINSMLKNQRHFRDHDRTRLLAWACVSLNLPIER